MLAIDSLSGAEMLLQQHVTDRDFKGDAARFADYGRGNAIMGREFPQVLAKLEWLRDHKELKIVMLAHAAIRKRRDPSSIEGDYDVTCGISEVKMWEPIKQTSDQIAYATFDTVVRQTKEQRNRIRLRSNERWLIFGADPARDTKTRSGYEMPDRIPLSWQSYAEATNGDAKGDIIAQILAEMQKADADTSAKAAKGLKVKEITESVLKKQDKKSLDAICNWLTIQNNKKEGE